MAINRFSFLRKNFINTDSMLYFSSGSTTASNIYDGKQNTKWASSGENTDGDTATISILLPSSTIASRLGIINHNFKAFNVIYNSNTANQFNPGLSVTANTISNTFYSFASQAILSIDINIWNTIVTNTEKSCAEIILSDHKFTLNQNPDSADYQPNYYKKGVEHELSDGGITSVFIAGKYKSVINLNYINTATHDNLRTLYNDYQSFIFVPYSQDTFTSYWDGIAPQVNWLGDLQIDTLKSNHLVNGYIGSLNLGEV